MTFAKMGLGASQKPENHKCIWFHSIDIKHNICACKIHELYDDKEKKYLYFKAEDCPKCARSVSR